MMGSAGKPLSSYRPRSRVIPPLPRVRALDKPPLWEFVLLSMLVHAVAIALFGAPSGGSREGRAMWGALQVVLLGPSLDAEPRLRLDRGLGEDAARPARTPAKRAKPAPRVEPVAPVLRPEARIESIAPPVATPPVEAPPVEVPLSIPPLLDRIVAPEIKRELTPFRVPPPTPVQAPPAPLVAPAPARVEAPTPVERPAARVERVPAEAPPIAAPIAQPVPPPLPERVATPPVEIAPVASPVVPAIPTPPVERAPVEVPAIPVPLESIATPQSEPQPRPVERAPAREVPIAPPPVAAPMREPAQQREAPVRVDRAPQIREEPALRPSPFGAPGPSIDSPRRPEEGSGSTTYDPTAPSVDLDAIRKRAAELARSGSGQRALLPFPMPPVPERKSKMETALEKARKPDCRTAYANLGLAAVVPLIANEFGEGSCRW